MMGLGPSRATRLSKARPKLQVRSVHSKRSNVVFLPNLQPQTLIPSSSSSSRRPQTLTPPNKSDTGNAVICAIPSTVPSYPSMSVEGNGVVTGGDRKHSPETRPMTSSTVTVATSQQRLRLNPNKDHKPESYEDLELEFSPEIFSSLERYLPPSMLGVERNEKVKFMREILVKYLPLGERNRAQRHREYRQKIMSNYQPLHREIYTIHPSSFFAPAFLKAISDNSEEAYRSIMSEPSPGIFTFDIFQPRFCELLLSEVENFEKWVSEAKFRIMRPNTMNKYGAVLDDFGLETMLEKLMENFVRPISKVFFPEVGGSTLDSHHGFVVEYGKDRDVDLAFHVDDSEVTLNVCLGKQFSGGELFFRGVRCDKHVNTGSHSEEIFDYCHEPGRAVLHRGRHRHGARATTSGHRINLLLWCRSSVFREMKKYQKEFSSWCGECLHDKKERQRQSIASTKSELLRKEGE